MTPSHCPECGNAVTDELPGGLCPTCLMFAAQQSQSNLAATAADLPVDRGFAIPGVEELGQLFPELEILHIIGRGGMGAVYKVRQKNLDRIVALKIFLYRPDDPEFHARFQREARALGRLKHQNIVTVHDFGERGGIHYLVMEYVDGLNLRQLTAEEKLSPELAIQLVPRLCDALQYAHDEGVIHRDIKPENILLDANGAVKIADFGLAKMSGNGQDPTLTHTQQVMGTINYMAPEQRERPSEVDHRADIYSLGVVIYEMLTGELPIGRFQPPSKKVEVNVRLDDVVMRALEKEPELRYQQASEFKTGIESVADSPRPEPVAAGFAASARPPVKPVYPATAYERAVQRDQQRRWYFTVLGSIVKQGNWTPAENNIVVSLLGRATLDLTEIGHRDVAINVINFLGNVRVVVPPTALVDNDGLIVLGHIRENFSGAGGTPTLRTRIRSYGLLGTTEVKLRAGPDPTPFAAGAAVPVPPVKSAEPSTDSAFGRFLMALYAIMHWIVVVLVPMAFLASAFNRGRDSKELVLTGVVLALVAVAMRMNAHNFRVMVRARPDESEPRKLAKYNAANWWTCLFRFFAVGSLFTSAVFFVATGFTDHEEEMFIMGGCVWAIIAVSLLVAGRRVRTRQDRRNQSGMG